MNESSEAAESGTGGWLDAVTYMAGLSGGSWATATFIANNGKTPSELVDSVRYLICRIGRKLTLVDLEFGVQHHLPG